jgi:hypothetical protein
LNKRYGDRVAFLGVYVREAHPTDGAASAANANMGILVKQPKTHLERREVARACSAKLQMTIPLVVDTIDDRVGHAYSAMPDRLYVIDRDGKVAYQGGRGPFGFKPAELEQAIALQLLADGAPTKR